MSNLIKQELTQSPVGTMYVEKDQWALYSDYHRQMGSYEDLGYLDATEGLVEKIEAAMLITDQENFRIAMAALVANRKEMLSHAFSLMDNVFSNSAPTSNAAVKPKHT